MKNITVTFTEREARLLQRAADLFLSTVDKRDDFDVTSVVAEDTHKPSVSVDHACSKIAAALSPGKAR